ncbi:hypothetical protein DFH94DRAFT_685824 [Russula ochroleuca]|uniref:Uncharacterized protein n=1 Tax=Russula ochroleuca TaxID=152965 RepID=A0A9P5JXK4_9AGAM|nr:hypothetical protein DFH94DRAFT_685824 [Russula ochroleuca]
MEAQPQQAQPTASQPSKSIQMDAMNPATSVSKQHEHQHKARRLRGGGAARNVLSASNAARIVASAVPTSSAAPARCAAECIRRNPTGDGRLFIDRLYGRLLYIFFISFHMHATNVTVLTKARVRVRLPKRGRRGPKLNGEVKKCSPLQFEALARSHYPIFEAPVGIGRHNILGCCAPADLQNSKAFDILLTSELSHSHTGVPTYYSGCLVHHYYYKSTAWGPKQLKPDRERGMKIQRKQRKSRSI